MIVVRISHLGMGWELGFVVGGVAWIYTGLLCWQCINRRSQI